MDLPIDIPGSAIIHPRAFIGNRTLPTKAIARQPSNYDKLTIGERVTVGCFAVVYMGVNIGDDTLIGDGAIIREGVRIGRECIIGQHVSINYNASIGDRVRIMNGTHITGNMRIEDDVFIGVNVTFSNDKNIDPLNYEYDPNRIKGPIIGRGVMIGSGANILAGVEIGMGAMIGAGALVTKHVKPGQKVYGARAIHQDDVLYNRDEALKGLSAR